MNMAAAVIDADFPNLPSTIFPLADLPNEILHMIFEQLMHRDQDQDQEPDIAHLRLVCKHFADIGSYYLLSDAHLFFKSSQFERLRQISEHPVISKKIETLYYEADTLPYYASVQEWKENICVPGWMNNVCPESHPPLPMATAREERAYNRSLNKARHGPKYTLSETLLRRAYGKYKSHLADQEGMRWQNYNVDVLKDALRRMPNVKTIEMTTECCLGRSTGMVQAFKDGLAEPNGDMYSEEGCGVGQLRSLLLAADAANLQFETLAAGNVEWRFFQESYQQTQEDLRKMQSAVRALQTLKLYITTRTGDPEFRLYETPFNNMAPACAEYLHTTSHLKDFITSTPDLERLDLNFDCDEPHPATLCDSIGTFTWHSLRVAAFACISADEDCLAHFFVRHASTLRKLRLEAILLDRGTWPSLLRRARKALKLEQASLSGRLRSLNPNEVFYFDIPAGLNGGNRAKLEVVVEKYLLKGGEGPLLDLRALEEKYSNVYVPPDENLPMLIDSDSDESIMDRF